MNEKNYFVATIKAVFSGYFAFFASLASIIGVVILFFVETWAVLTALVFFCLMLLVFTVVLVRLLLKSMNYQFSINGNRSTFIKYETSDGNMIQYETYLVTQVKTPVMTEHEYNFKWTGSQFPRITSDLQNVEHVFNSQDQSKIDKAILKLKKPAYYNETVVIHFKADLDDTDHKSEPFVGSRVTVETAIIHFRVILKHLPDSHNKNAVLERWKIQTDVGALRYEKLKEVAFDRTTKSYEYHLLNPEINYFYRIRWAD